jgi:imidazolonepropionase-like amidohydrolase
MGRAGSGRAAYADTIGIRDVTVLDVASGRRLPDHVVLVEGRRIVAVGGAGVAARAKPGTRWVEGRGRTLVPGLWDMHTHVCNDSMPACEGSCREARRSLGGARRDHAGEEGRDGEHDREAGVEQPRAPGRLAPDVGPRVAGARELA